MEQDTSKSIIALVAECNSSGALSRQRVPDLRKRCETNDAAEPQRQRILDVS